MHVVGYCKLSVIQLEYTSPPFHWQSIADAILETITVLCHSRKIALWDTNCRFTRQYKPCPISLVFICRENPRRSGILLFPDHPRFCQLMKTRNRRYRRSSGMNGEKSGESRPFLFSWRVPDFRNGRRSFLTNENSNLNRQGRWHPSVMDFANQSPKLLGASSPITNKHIVFRKSGTGLWRISDISAKSGMVGKKSNPRSSAIFRTNENQAILSNRYDP